MHVKASRQQRQSDACLEQARGLATSSASKWLGAPAAREAECIVASLAAVKEGGSKQEVVAGMQPEYLLRVMVRFKLFCREEVTVLKGNKEEAQTLTGPEAATYKLELL